MNLLSELSFKGNYKTSDNFLNSVIKPSLQKDIVSFSALSAYFSVDTLVLLSEELDSFFNKDGVLKYFINSKKFK